MAHERDDTRDIKLLSRQGPNANSSAAVDYNQHTPTYALFDMYIRTCRCVGCYKCPAFAIISKAKCALPKTYRGTANYFLLGGQASR